MSGIKKLAGQTLWYGVPSILARFIGYLTNFSLVFFFGEPGVTAVATQFYAVIPFLSILFTYGLETAYFRFSQTEDRDKLYSTLNISIFLTTALLGGLLFWQSEALARFTGLHEQPGYVQWLLWILMLDTLTALPFARLRQESRPKRYAFVRLAGIALNCFLVLFCLGYLPGYAKGNPDSLLSIAYSRTTPISYVFLANLAGSALTLLLLLPELLKIRLRFDAHLWRKVLRYAAPLIIVGMGGMVNDMLSRLAYTRLVDLSAKEAAHELGIFGNIFRIAVLVTVAIQAFRMAAEPFFFSRASEKDAPRTYARVMKWFVIVCCFLFLGIALFRDLLEWIITLKSPAWGEGMYVVPLLTMGNIFLGIYYNLSIWYKLTDKNRMGALITIAGAVLTIVLNVLLIPHLHYLGAALATFACYLFMMVVSYRLGQRYYPIPYARKKLIAYLVIVSGLYGLHRLILMAYSPLWFSLLTGALLFAAFAWFIRLVEQKELQQMFKSKSPLSPGGVT